MKQTIPVVGLACSACSANVEKKLSSLRGIHSASVSLASRTALVDFDPAVISLEQMKREVNDIGYDLVIESGRSAEEIHRQEFTLLRRRTLLSWVLAILVMCLSMGWISVGSVLAGNVLSLLLALVCMLLCGRNIYVSAWRQLFHRTANMDTLVALSTLIAFLLSTFNTFFGDTVWGSRGIGWHTFFDASVMIITFVLTGRLLEEKSQGRRRKQHPSTDGHATQDGSYREW